MSLIYTHVGCICCLSEANRIYKIQDYEKIHQELTVGKCLTYFYCIAEIAKGYI